MKKILFTFLVMLFIVSSCRYAWSATATLLTDSPIIKESSGWYTSVTISGKIVSLSFTDMSSVISSPDGITWTYVTKLAKVDLVSEITGMDTDDSAVVYQNYIYIWGRSGDENAVMRSSDYGKSWSKIGNANINTVGYKKIYFEGNFWSFVKVGSDYSWYSSLNGIIWTKISGDFTGVFGIPAITSWKGRLVAVYENYSNKMTMASMLPNVPYTVSILYDITTFPPRESHSISVLNDRLYIVSGFNEVSEFLNDIWSTDKLIGVDDMTENDFVDEGTYGESAGLDGREKFSMVVYNNNIVLFGGIGMTSETIGRVYKIITSASGTSTPTATLTRTPTPTQTHTATRTTTPTRTPAVIYTYTITPSRTSTVTITPTRTNTPALTPTATVTVTPIYTAQPMLRYRSIEVDRHKTQTKVEFDQFYGLGGSYVVTLFEPEHNKRESFVLDNSMDEDKSAEIFGFTIDTLKHDYCYYIGLTVKADVWSSPAYADTIVVCPYQTPTPYIGTATATDTPDCTPPTNTPTPEVTVALTVAGLLAYEDFEGQADAGTAVSTPFVVSAPSGKSYVVRTQGGLKCIQPSDTTFAYDNVSNFIYTTITANNGNELFIQRIHQGNGTSDRQAVSFFKPYNASGFWWTEAWIANTNWWQTTNNRFSAIGARENTANIWYLLQTYLSSTVNEATSTVYAVGVTRTNSSQKNTFASGLALSLTPTIHGFSMDSRSGTMYEGKFLYARSKYAYFSAPVSTTVEILNPTSGEIMYTAKVTNTASPVPIDLTGNSLPMRVMLRISDPNMHKVSTTESMNLCGGDIWTFNFSQTYPNK